MENIVVVDSEVMRMTRAIAYSVMRELGYTNVAYANIRHEYFSTILEETDDPDLIQRQWTYFWYFRPCEKIQPHVVVVEVSGISTFVSKGNWTHEVMETKFGDPGFMLVPARQVSFQVVSGGLGEFSISQVA